MPDLLSKMGAAVLLSEHELMKLIRSAPRRYKVYPIPKRKAGEVRIIAQPAREVKALQYWLIDKFLDKLPVHSSATAYRIGKNIAHNARVHRLGSYVLKMDFKDFFPSIKAHDFRRYCKRNKIELESRELDAILRILFWKPKDSSTLILSIGAPSSPLLSNILMRDFDEKVAKFCAKKKVRYTRYADDLSFSSKNSSSLREVENYVTVLCERIASPKLVLHQDKLVRVSKRDSRRITGLIITNDAKVSLGRELKRKIRAAVHYFRFGRLDLVKSLELKGMLAYVKSVEPSFLIRLQSKYGVETIKKLQSLS
jgi:RNA-directed DNA polymerase